MLTLCEPAQLFLKRTQFLCLKVVRYGRGRGQCVIMKIAARMRSALCTMEHAITRALPVTTGVEEE